MPSALPEGEPVPDDGALPAGALREVGERTLSIYVHVPFCAARCGYCDFNTYTPTELGGAPGTDPLSYLQAAVAELDLAAETLGPLAPPVSTVFVGGGTPTLLAADAEVTTEANPESVDEAGLSRLVEAGFTRISFGMQSAVPHVLATLDRRHAPGRPEWCVGRAKTAGFASTSLDLIYGTPGESLTDWRTSLEAALAAEPDHVSAYALVVEDGTRLAARVRRGELPAPDDDDLAEKYLLAEEALTAAGLTAYEVSNWARTGADRCRHNLAYWRSAHWWGIGPGAHSHVGGVRWWNVKHPARYAARLAGGQSPASAREVLPAASRRVERVLLELRLAEGLDLAVLAPTERARVPAIVERGLATVAGDRLVLTLPGRLLADGVVRDLLD
ncbi:MAG: radical SAM family heme chaperone HemW [Actinomycetes bacterium]